MPDSAAEMRPLAVTPPRPDGDGIAFWQPGRDVRVEGDRELLLAVVGRCDGVHTLERIVADVAPDAAEEVRGLVEGLAAEGVLVDATRSWQAFHRHSSNSTGFLAPPPSEDELAALMHARFRPETDGRSEPIRPAATTIGEIAGRRVSGAAGEAPRGPSFEELGALLATMYSAGESGRMTVPSAGAFYALTLHVALRSELGPLEPGLWWHDPAGALALVRPGRPEVEPFFLEHPVTDPILEREQPIVFVSADVERPSRKYSNRAYRFALMETGAAMQNAYLAGAELGVPVRAIGGFLDDPVREFLATPEGCVPMLALMVGA